MSEKKPEMKRDGTMQVTAKEGVQFLKAVDEELLEIQGLSAASKPQSSSRNVSGTTSAKPDLSRLNTMEVTSKEGERYLKEVWNYQSPGTNDTDDGNHGTTPSKPKLSKFTTMLQTKKEGEAYIGGQGIDEDAKTRTQQDQLEKILDEPAAKRAKTVNERGNRDKPSTKRVSTIVRTAQEGEELLKELGHKDDNPESETGRRRTRSQTRGVPPLPPPAKRERKSTPNKDGHKNDGSKGRGRGRPKKEEKKEEEKPADENPIDEDEEEKDHDMVVDDNAKEVEEKKEDAVAEKPAAPAAATNQPSTTNAPASVTPTTPAPATGGATEQKN